MDKARSTASHSVPQCATGTVRTEERNARTCIFDTRGYRALEHAAVDMAGTLFTARHRGSEYHTTRIMHNSNAFRRGLAGTRGIGKFKRQKRTVRKTQGALGGKGI